MRKLLNHENDKSKIKQQKELIIKQLLNHNQKLMSKVKDYCEEHIQLTITVPIKIEDLSFDSIKNKVYVYDLPLMSQTQYERYEDYPYKCLVCDINFEENPLEHLIEKHYATFIGDL